MQVLVQLFQLETLVFEEASVCGLDVKSVLCSRHALQPHNMSLTLDGCCMLDNDVIPQEFGLVIRCTVDIAGGKGGYGAMLRQMAKQSGAKKTTDFGACRDLSGRRLRHVNDEMVLQKWKESRENGKEFDTEQITQTGIDMWFLAAPSWADGFKTVKPRKKFMKGRMKTRICLDWERARKDGRAPKNAPNWWGCPRGSRCEYAHGEAELPKEVIQELKEKRKQEQRDKANEKRMNYISTADGLERSDAEMAEMILAGLQAAKRSKTEEAEIPMAPTEDIIPIYVGSTVDPGLSIPVLDPAAHVVGGDDINSSATSIAEDPGSAEIASTCTWLTILSGKESHGTYAPPTIDMNGVIVGNGADGLASVGITGCFLTQGQWYFEVEALTEGLVQIGLGDDSMVVSSLDGDGVGDDAHSWSFDGARSCLWHNGKERAFGSGKWVAGDVVGVYVSIKEIESKGCETKKRGRGKEPAVTFREISIGFSINGNYLGDAFVAESSGPAPAQYFYPVISLESGESALVNIGQKAFQYYCSGTIFNQVVDASVDPPLYIPIVKSLDADVASSIIEYLAFYSSVSKNEKLDPLANQRSIAGSTSSLIPSDGVERINEQPIEKVHYDQIEIESSEFSDAAESFHRFGLQHLKAELERRGLKSGGTLSERADRLFAVRGVPFDKIDKKYKAKK